MLLPGEPASAARHSLGQLIWRYHPRRKIYEVFAEGVSKADGAAWLLERHGIDRRRVLALGNDFNDESLLAWAAESRVVANAPAALRQRFDVVPDNQEHGFSVAVDAWRRRQGL